MALLLSALLHIGVAAIFAKQIQQLGQRVQYIGRAELRAVFKVVRFAHIDHSNEVGVAAVSEEADRQDVKFAARESADEILSLKDPEANSDKSNQLSKIHQQPKRVSDHSKYYLLTELEIPPRQLSEISILWHSKIGVAGKRTGVFTVLVDVEGNVVDVVADAHTLLPGMEGAVIRSFKQAKFSPGYCEGVQVNVALRIEVTFEGEMQSATPEVVTRMIE